MKTFANTNPIRRNRAVAGSTDISASDFDISTSIELEECNTDIFEEVPNWVKSPTVPRSTVQKYPNIIRKFVPGLLSNRNPRQHHMRKNDYLLLQQEIAKTDEEQRRVAFVLKTQDNTLGLHTNNQTIPAAIQDRIEEIENTEVWEEQISTGQEDEGKAEFENWLLVYTINQSGGVEDVSIKASVTHDLGNRPASI